MTIAVNSYLGPYRLSKLVNNGQTCQLWQAVNDRKNQFVAVKTLAERHLKNRSEMGLLKWEYTVGSKLDHPNCVHFIDFGMEGPQPYMVMEWFAAPNLKSLIREGFESYAWRMSKLVPMILASVEHMHSRGFVHRDIKPENFLVDTDDNLKLIDYALALKKKNCLTALFSGKQKVQGTRSYMSPEQIRGQWVDGRADIYSLGCMFFEMVTGKAPYSGTSETELFQKHLNAPIPVPSQVNPEVTKEFSDMIRQMLAKEADKRFSSVHDLINAYHALKIFRRTQLKPRTDL